MLGVELLTNSLNRFSQDISLVDKQLPPALANLSVRKWYPAFLSFWNHFFFALTIATRDLQASGTDCAHSERSTFDDNNCPNMFYLRIFHPASISPNV